MIARQEELQHYAPHRLFRRGSAQKSHRHVAAIETVIGHGCRYHCFPQAEGAFVPLQLLASGVPSILSTRLPLSMSGTCGRSTRSGSPVTVLWWPPRRTASHSPRLAISLPNWKTFFTCPSKSLCCNWSRTAGSPGSQSPAISVLRRQSSNPSATVDSTAIAAGLGHRCARRYPGVQRTAGGDCLVRQFAR